MKAIRVIRSKRRARAFFSHVGVMISSKGLTAEKKSLGATLDRISDPSRKRSCSRKVEDSESRHRLASNHLSMISAPFPTRILRVHVRFIYCTEITRSCVILL